MPVDQQLKMGRLQWWLWFLVKVVLCTALWMALIHYLVKDRIISRVCRSSLGDDLHIVRSEKARTILSAAEIEERRRAESCKDNIGYICILFQVLKFLWTLYYSSSVDSCINRCFTFIQRLFKPSGAIRDSPRPQSPQPPQRDDASQQYRALAGMAEGLRARSSPKPSTPPRQLLTEQHDERVSNPYPPSCDALQDAVAARASRETELERKIKDLTAENNGLKEQQHPESGAQISNLHSQIQALQAENKRLREEVHQTQARTREIQAEKNRLDEQCRQVETDQKSCADENRTLKTRNTDLDEQLKTLRGQLQTLDSRYGALHSLRLRDLQTLWDVRKGVIALVNLRSAGGQPTCVRRGDAGRNEVIVSTEADSLGGEARQDDKVFTCHGVIVPEEESEAILSVHDYVQVAVELVHRGSRQVLIADGQSGTGKSYTLFDGPCCVARFATRLMLGQQHASLVAWAVEIYENCGYDLLTESDSNDERLPGSPKNWISALRTRPVASEDDVIQIIAELNHHRHKANKSLNRSSSRGFVFFALELRPTNVGSATVGEPESPKALTLIDLAGSELEQGNDAADIRNSRSDFRTALRTFRQGFPINPPAHKLGQLFKVCIGDQSRSKIIHITHVSQLKKDIKHTRDALNQVQEITKPPNRSPSKKPPDLGSPSPNNPGQGSSIPKSPRFPSYR